MAIMPIDGTINRWLQARAVRVGLVLLAFGAAVPATAATAGDNCASVRTAPLRLGVSRTLEIDTIDGPILGAVTRLPHAQGLLAPKEIVLTFDDGPLPWITRSILATLARHCTRATFFSVGQMALAYPNVVREELAQGHTVGTHTWSHPLNLKRLKPAAAEVEMERGFAAVAAAAGRPVSAFFRFPGLSDSASMVAHLASRHVAAIGVDVVSNDSYIHDPARLTRETLAKVEANHGGIILFHDIKATTAKALPGILDALAARGYSVVQLASKQPLDPNPDLEASFLPQVARTLARIAAAKPGLVPFYGTVGPERVPRGAPEAPPVATSSAEPAGRLVAHSRHHLKHAIDRQSAGTSPQGWSTSVRPDSMAN